MSPKLVAALKTLGVFAALAGVITLFAFLPDVMFLIFGVGVLLFTLGAFVYAVYRMFLDG